MPQNNINNSSDSSMLTGILNWIKANVLLTIGIVIALTIIVVLVVVNTKPTTQAPTSQTNNGIPKNETPQERDVRLSLMNILNNFSKETSSEKVSQPLSESQRKELEGRIAQTIQQFQDIKTTGSMQQAQERLVTLFSSWNDRLENNTSTESLKGDFSAVATEYPWLHTLLWIVIFNSL